MIGSPNSGTLCLPHGVALDSANRLYIADTVNERVLEFDTPLGGGPGVCSFRGRCANRVFGQGGAFNTNNVNKGGESANSLYDPWGVALDRSSPNHLYVADFQNHRVLEYDKPLTTATASRVFGQSSFSGPTNCNQGNAAPTAGTLCYPRWVGTDSVANLYVSDSGNNRVLQYIAPLTNATADRVFGQGSAYRFTFNKCYTGPNGLCAPDGIAVDPSNNLFVVDASNYRILEYFAP